METISIEEVREVEEEGDVKFTDFVYYFYQRERRNARNHYWSRGYATDRWDTQETDWERFLREG